MNPIEWLSFALAVSAAYARDAVAVAQGQAPTPTNSLDGLRPDVRERVRAVMTDAAAKGRPLRADETFRTYLRQAYLHDQYMNHGGPRAAPPGLSNHEQGKAVDLWPIGVPYDHDAEAIEILDEIARDVAPAHGLASGASYGDHDHFSEDGR